MQTDTVALAPSTPDTHLTDTEAELARLLIEALNLDISIQDIDPEASLQTGHLGLDSIDILEVVLLMSTRYGIELRMDTDEIEEIFRSLRTLEQYIAAHRSK